MCDFHSVIVDGAGRIYHLPSNSHSAIAAHYNLDNADLSAPFWECEWNGIGELPIHLVQPRGKTIEPTSAASMAADRHYAKLAKILRGELECSETSPFDSAEYSDVPARIEWSKAETIRLAEREAANAKRRAAEKAGEELGTLMFSVFGEKLEALTDSAMIIAIRQFVLESSVTMEDTAADEIEAATESATEDMIHQDNVYDYVLGDGEYIDRNEVADYAWENERSELVDKLLETGDYYDQSMLDDAIADAKTEWMREAVSALEAI